MLVLGARQSNNASLAATQAARGQRSVKPVDESLQNRIRSHGREYITSCPYSVVHDLWSMPSIRFSADAFFPLFQRAQKQLSSQSIKQSYSMKIRSLRLRRLKLYRDDETGGRQKGKDTLSKVRSAQGNRATLNLRSRKSAAINLAHQS